MSGTKQKKKGNATTLILVVMLIAGILLLAYPTFADWWNSFHATRAIASYAEKVEKMDSKEFDELRVKAEEYNRWLLSESDRYHPDAEALAYYKNTLDVTGTGIMGYIDIPKVRVLLPMYHTTDESVLQVAIGHLTGTSLPVGGESTHCVLSGHRGLPSARLFTDIDRLSEGDTFRMNVLNETLTYEVDQIRKVLPYELEHLEIEKGQDYCTLVTCTPYGVNTHRLLIRGHRVETEEELHVTADAIRMNQYYIAAGIGMIILAALLAGWLLYTSRKRRKKKQK